MKRFLAACTLAAASLLAVATPAGAAPPEHYVDSGCVDYTSYIYCYRTDYRVKQTLTPSGNEIYHSSGTNSFDVTFDDGGGYGNTWSFDLKFQYKKGQLHVDRTKAAHTYYYGNSSCTDLTHYKFTNGKVQIENYETTCNF